MTVTGLIINFVCHWSLFFSFLSQGWASSLECWCTPVTPALRLRRGIMSPRPTNVTQQDRVSEKGAHGVCAISGASGSGQLVDRAQETDR